MPDVVSNQATEMLAPVEPVVVDQDVHDEVPQIEDRAVDVENDA